MSTVNQRAQEEHSEHSDHIEAKDSQEQEASENFSEESKPSEPENCDQIDISYEAQAMSQKQQLVEMENRLLRLQADFDNFRRRSRQEKEVICHRANSEMLTAMLPVLDNFQRALAAQEGQEDSFTAGVKMIYQQFYKVLTDQGLTVIEAVGQQFDPNYHEAVMMVEDENSPPNTVVEEMQKGYKVGTKVIRTSVVKVANCK